MAMISRTISKAGLCIIAGLGLLFGGPLSAQQLPQELAKSDRALTLVPATPWHLDMADDRCRLARKFNSEDGPGLLLIEQIAPGHHFDLTIAAPNLGLANTSAFTYFGMRSDREVSAISPFETLIDGYGEAFIMPSATIALHDLGGETPVDQAAQTHIAPADAQQANRIVVKTARTVVSFETGSMAQAFEALNACAFDVLRGLGLDTDAYKGSFPPAMPEQQTLFARMQHQFAKGPGRRGNKALVRFRALIAADGTVSDCYSDYALSSGDVDKDICEDIRGVRFEPGRDRDGKAINSVFSASIPLNTYSPWASDAHGER